MISPGFKSLGNFTISANGTQVGEWVTDLDGLLAAAVQARLAYGSGGGTVKLYLQTSLDQGNTAIDIACIVFGAAGEVALLNFSALTPKTTQVVPTDGAMTDDTAVDGILGDRLRCKVVSSGTVYGGSTTLSVGAAVR